MVRARMQTSQRENPMNYFAKNLTAFGAFLVLAGIATAHDYKVGDLVIDHPVARATPVNAPVAGGFMTITNNGAEDDRLIAATSAIAGKTEIHEMAMDGDVMKMREIEGGIVIPSGGTVTLMPGGLHVMFMQLGAQLKEGETHDAVLTFEKAGQVTVTFNVEDLAAIRARFVGKAMNHGTMNHGTMSNGAAPAPAN